MKSTLIFVLCLAAALAAPQVKYPEVRTLSEVNENDGTGYFKSSYSLTDGTNRDESGSYTPLSPADPSRNVEATGIQVMRGVISWVAPDGTPFTLEYIADDKGFRPVGSHLPRK
ncbi:unnamed protein product [Allacma fusca]|uniref:Uncharacterized protein n=1 Tax=Allacma fusca TaxID=39272 RepID=A0A8J2JDQ5_9HEXA|nr:unnamed protein product [Allacma fusca]